MELYYCDTCGLRISPADLGAQTSTAADGKFWCAKCRPAPLPAPVAGKSPVRGSQTLIPVRQPSSAHIPAAPRKSSGSHASPAGSPHGWILPVSGGAVALLLGAIVFGTSGGSTTRISSAPEPDHTAAPAPVKITPVNPSNSVTPVRRKDPPRDTAVAPPTTDVREDAAQKAYDALSRELKDGSATDRIAALENFVAKYDGAIIDARARTQLNELKAALPPTVAPEPEKAAIQVPAVDKPAPPPQSPVPANTASLESDAEIRAAYSAFLERFWNALARRDPAGAASFLAQARSEKSLKTKSAELDEERSMLKLYDEFQEAVPKGLLKAGDLDNFELQRGKTGVIKVGKRGEFQIASVNNGMISLAANGVSMTVALDALTLATWARLAELENKGGPMVLFLNLLAATPESLDASKLRSQLAALDKSAPADVLGAFSRRVSGLEETAAIAAFAKVEKQAENRDRAALAAALSAFKRSFGATDLAAQKSQALKVFESRSTPILVPDGLITYFSLDENEGKIARDGVLGGPDAQLSNCNWVAGKFGGALSFKDPASSARFNGIPIKPNAISLSVWVNHRETTGRYERYFFLAGDGAIIRREQGGKLEVVLKINDKLEFLSASTVANNRWQHVAATWDGQELRLYHDGALVNSAAKPGSLTSTTEGLLSCPNNSEFLAGALDEVRIYNRALSPAEIKQLAEQKNSKE